MTNKSISIHENQFLPEYDEYYKIRKNISTKETEEMKLLNIMIDNGGKVIVDNET